MPEYNSLEDFFDDCSLRGHSWSVIMEDGIEDPIAVYCTFCGRRCLVVSDGQNTRL